MTSEAETKPIERLNWSAPYTARFVEYNRGKREYAREYVERTVDDVPAVGLMMAMGDTLYVVEVCYLEFETGVVTVALHRETGTKPYTPGMYQKGD